MLDVKKKKNEGFTKHPLTKRMVHTGSDDNEWMINIAIMIRQLETSMIQIYNSNLDEHAFDFLN